MRDAVVNLLLFTAAYEYLNRELADVAGGFPAVAIVWASLRAKSAVRLGYRKAGLLLRLRFNRASPYIPCVCTNHVKRYSMLIEKQAGVRRETDNSGNTIGIVGYLFWFRLPAAKSHGLECGIFFGASELHGILACWRAVSSLLSTAMESDAPSPEQQVRYEIRDLIGSGGAGKVYKAWDNYLRRFVAIKRFGQEYGAPTTEDERAWREAMTLASIQHPNILTVFDFGTDEDGPYVITEFLEGETLDVVADREPLTAKVFRDLVRQTLEGLISAHQIGLIHRDLKPQNIMVMQLASGARQFKILDFGLAKILQEPMVQTMDGNQAIVGSIFYITPEQLSRRPVDERSDLYAVGCVYYFALTGKQAFEGDSITEIITSHIKHRVVPLSQKRPDLQPPMCDWVMKLMSVQPDHRYQTAADALNAFQKIRVGKTILISSKSSPIKLPEQTAVAPEPAPAVEPPPAAPGPAKKKNRLPAIISSVALVVILATMGIRSRSSGRKTAAPAVPTAPVATPAPRPPVAPPTVTAPPAATKVPSKPAPANNLAQFAITAEIIQAKDMGKLRSRVGQEVAIRGRVSGVRSRGEEMFIDFEGVQTRTVSLSLPLSKDNRSAELSHARRYREQMICVQGVVEIRDENIVVRGRDLRQLDILPPL